MWAAIFLTVISLFGLCFFYLITRFKKLYIVNRLAGTKKGFKTLFAFIFLILIVELSTLLLSFVNAIIIILHIAVFWLITDLILWVIRKFKKDLKLKKLCLSGILAFSITAVYLSIGAYLCYHVFETKYDITTTKNIEPIRVGLIADSHTGTTFNGVGLGEELQKLQAANPDVLIVSGDLVDDSTTFEDMINTCASLGNFKCRYGVYYVFGNHDRGYYAAERRGYDEQRLVDELIKNNVKVLKDDVVYITDNVVLIGRDDASARHRRNIADLVSDIPSEKYMIVLNHQPNDYDNEAAANVDLVLSGHTHGGQLFPATHVGEWIGANDATYGYSKRDNTDFIVTSGISDWEIKFKTGCASEYVIIDINKE